MGEQDYERLTRIENKVDRLADAITEMIKFEAHLAAHTTALERFGFRLDNMEARIEEIEKGVPIWNLWSGWAGKLTMTALIALVGSVLALVIT